MGCTEHTDCGKNYSQSPKWEYEDKAGQLVFLEMLTKSRKADGQQEPEPQ
jgi:hypothetical protein